MKRAFFTAVTLAATVVPLLVSGTDPFEQKLSPDQEIAHALNRLTFGARPGDAEQVRRIGLTKWMEQQLHPDQIAENPVVEQRLKPLETIGLPLEEVIARSSPDQSTMMMMIGPEAPFQVLNKLPQSVRMRVLNGTAEERTAALDVMEPDMRSKVLAALPENVLEYTPKYREDGEKARKAAQTERQAENRKRNPRLADLLEPPDVAAIRSDDKDRIIAVVTKLDEEKRRAVVGQLPLKSQAYFPAERREWMMRQTPRLAASEDVKEARIFRAVYSTLQLEEVLVDYWFNHFNVDSTKNVAMTQNLGHLLIGSYERDAIRPHVLGHFKDLLLATARHPAMLYYWITGNRSRPTVLTSGPSHPGAETSTACQIRLSQMGCNGCPTG